VASQVAAAAVGAAALTKKVSSRLETLTALRRSTVSWPARACTSGRLSAAAPAGEENYWAASCLARTAGRLHGDRDALQQSLDGWERIDARFERACTLMLLPDRADGGRAELRALGCRPPAA